MSGNSTKTFILMSLPSKATEIPLIFPCWMNTVNEFFLSASPATKPAPWQVTFVEAILVVTCGRAKSINKSVVVNCKKCAIVSTTATARSLEGGLGRGRAQIEGYGLLNGVDGLSLIRYNTVVVGLKEGRLTGVLD